MEEYIIYAMNKAADIILDEGNTKEETIAEMRDWIDSWEASDDD